MKGKSKGITEAESDQEDLKADEFAYVRSESGRLKRDEYWRRKGGVRDWSCWVCSFMAGEAPAPTCYTVRATVRDPNDPKKTEHLLSLDGAKERLRLFKADLLEEGSFDPVVDGCDGVFHTASPVVMQVTDPQTELIDPALKGTINVLRSSKHFPKTTSYTWVDARDVANAHIQAFELPEASGRYCLEDITSLLLSLFAGFSIEIRDESTCVSYMADGKMARLVFQPSGYPRRKQKVWAFTSLLWRPSRFEADTKVTIVAWTLHSSRIFGGANGQASELPFHNPVLCCIHREILKSVWVLGFGFCGGGGSMRNRRVLYDDEGKGVAGGMEDEDESMEVEVADSDSDVNEEEDDEEGDCSFSLAFKPVQSAIGFPYRHLGIFACIAQSAIEQEEGQDEYEDDGFIVNEDEQEDGDPDEPRQKKMKKRKIDLEKNFVLDEDDYVLLEDNNVLGIRRPKAGTKKFKRLKKAGKDTDPRVHSDFFDEDGLLLDDIDDDEAKSKYDDEDVIGDDEMDGFIVDAEETDGCPVRKLKRKSRQEYGVSSSTVEEAHDIFGDPNEYLNRRKKKKYLTEKDDLIRNIDMPERIQISEESTGPAPVDIMSIKEETSWILSQLTTKITWFCKMKVIEGNDEGPDLFKKVEQDIERFLKLHHVEKHDIPFIAMYRKELCLSLLKDPEQDVAENEDEDETKRTTRLKRNKVILWVIKDLDRKWLLLRKRKNALQLYYNKRYEEELLKMHDEARLNLNKELFKSISNSLKNAESEIEVDDVNLKFNLHFPLDEVNVSQGQFKRPKRKSHYKVCSNAGLWEVAAKFGCNSEQFGLQVTLVNVRREDLEDLKESPEEIASTFTGPVFETPQAVLKGARHMAAVEISSEPCFRKHVRSIFMEEAVVSTRPTPKGNMVIDPSHEFSGFKWLHGKPLSQFKDAQWLLIQRAEEEKLLEDAFSNFLLPYMEKQARVFLTAKAKAWLLEEYGKQLWNRASVAPYQHKENDDELDEETAPRVMACCWDPGNPATTFVMLDSLGEVMDVLHASSLIIWSRNNQKQQKQKKIDQERVREFMTEHQPHVVVLGAVNLACRRLKEEIYEIIFKMMEENPRDVSQKMDGIRIVYGDESLPRIYEHSRISSDQLPGQLGIVKRAVALGRFLQNPLAMIATLCGPGKEILSWKLGSLGYLLTPDEKYEMVEQVMVDVTNQVGIDINLAAAHDWLFAPLQFVSGLGPSKAGHLQRALIRIGAVTCRKKLIEHGLGTMSVFRSAVGFLRVRCCGMASASSNMDLLDDTRIHPESYNLAKILAKDVYKCFENDEIDDVVLEMAIGYVRNHPKYLEDLKIFEYAKDYEIKHGKNKRETLYDIKMELLHGFRDWRSPYEEPSEDEEFLMITGENGDTLAEGKIVQATVRSIQSERVFCVLDSGLDGILFKDGFSDERDEIDLTTKLQVGEILICKIKQIEKNRHRVVLTCKEIQSRSSKDQNPRSVDPYYCEDQSSLSQEQEKAQKELAKKHVKPRMIVHPRFQNITFEEAMEYLSDKAVGESTFHPSSRGSSYLSLTIKIYDGVYAHKEITEGGKDQKDAMSLLHLGKTLKIGDENFEDLDEVGALYRDFESLYAYCGWVMDRYVDPLVTHLKAMLNYRKFRRGKKAEVDDLLRAEKSDYPMRIVYCFGICHEHPEKALSIQSVAAMVPMRSPAVGAPTGGGWESNTGGWRGQFNSSRDKTCTPSSRGKSTN
ncbi:Transcription elongation factor SPT6-like [Vitis vinifera]|uniref:Transcription elongation factor SPT6-like n=1 Tax=Vitis vinifera TaxID=29760 RepID=A0A438GWH9_VITVI|nr:Transcription elongation factor SPT6-like [Vitis vinifera]